MKKNVSNRGRSRLLLAAALSTGMAVAPHIAQAQSARNWIGNTDTDLATAANWDTLPVSGDSWIFGAPGTAGATLTNTLTTSSAFNVSGITFSSSNTTGYTIDSAHAGTFTLTGGITHQNSAVSSITNTIGSNIVVAAGTHTIALGGNSTTGLNLNLTGNLSGSGTISQTGQSSGVENLGFSGDNSGFTGSFTQDNANSTRTAFNTASSGSASAAWAFNRNVAGGVALNFTGTISFGSLSGGGQIRDNSGAITLQVGNLNADTTWSGVFASNNTLSLNKVGTGTLTLSGNNLNAGGTTVTTGKLAITNATNSLGTGSLSVTGGTIGGTGVGTTTVASKIYTINGGRIAPGAITTASNFGNAGTLTLTSTGTGGGISLTSANLDFDLAATAAGTSDKLALGASALTFGSIVFNFSPLSGVTTLETGTTYTLFTSTGTVSGFDTNNITTNFLGALAGNYTANYSLSGGTSGNLQVTFTAVPEPSEFALAIVGMLGMMVFICRRKQMM